MTRATAERLYQKDVADGWRRYLEDTKPLIGHYYEDTEPHAWARLETALAQAKALRLRRVGAA